MAPRRGTLRTVCVTCLPCLALPAFLQAYVSLNLRDATKSRPAAAAAATRGRDRDDGGGDAAACLAAPVTLAVGIGGRDCAARSPSVARLRTLLLSLEEAAAATGGEGEGRPTHVLLWLESGDATTLPLVEGVASGLAQVASVSAVDVGNATALTSEMSPPVTEAFVHRRYDFVKFWGIHRPLRECPPAPPPAPGGARRPRLAAANPRRYVLNVDVDAVFLRPPSEVWADGCRRLAAAPREAFYVAGRESLGTAMDHPGFARYVNSGVAFVDLLRREAAYNATALKRDMVPAVHRDKGLQTEGRWPPEQWLWNAMFHHHPRFLALFDNATQCNCATHRAFPGAEACKLAHYCNTAAASLFDSARRLPFSESLAEYIEKSSPRLYRRVTTAEPLRCPLSL